MAKGIYTENLEKIPKETLELFLGKSNTGKKVPKKHDYHINIFGTGQIGTLLLNELSAAAIEDDSKIKGINLYIRETPSFRLEDAKRANFSSFASQEENLETINNKINFKPIKTLYDSLNEITEESIKNENQGIKDITLILTRYEALDKLIKIDKDLKKIILPTQTELSKIFGSEENLTNNLKTTIYNKSKDEKEYLNLLPDFQRKRAKLENTINELFADLKLDSSYNLRMNMLKSNLIGVSELGKGLKNYKGTILNYVNDVEITTYSLMAETELPWNSVWSPIDNDWFREIATVWDIFYNNIKQNKNHDKKIVISKIAGGHGPNFIFDPSKISINSNKYGDVITVDPEDYNQMIEYFVQTTGGNMAKKLGMPSPDNIPAIMHQMKTILTNNPNIPHRCITYHPDYDTTLGIVGHILNNKLFIPTGKEFDPSNLSSEAQEKFEKYANTNKAITEFLIENQVIPRYEPKYSEIEQPEMEDAIEYRDAVQVITEKVEESITPKIDTKIEKLEKNQTRISKELEEKINLFVNGKEHPNLILYIKNSQKNNDIIVYKPYEDAFSIGRTSIPDDKYSVIKGLKAYPDKLLILQEIKKQNKFSYMLYELPTGSESPKLIKEFESSQITSFEIENNNLFYTLREENLSVIYSQENKSAKVNKIYKSKDEILRIKYLKSNNSLFWLTKNYVNSSNNDLVRFDQTPQNWNISNMQDIPVIGTARNKIISLQVPHSDFKKTFASDYNQFGLNTGKDGLELIFIKNDSANLYTTKNLESYKNISASLGAQGRSIIEDRIWDVVFTNNNVIIAGNAGQIIYERAPFKIGKTINAPGSIFSFTELNKKWL